MQDGAESAFVPVYHSALITVTITAEIPIFKIIQASLSRTNIKNMKSFLSKITFGSFAPVLSLSVLLGMTQNSSAATITTTTDSGSFSAFHYSQTTSIVPSHPQAIGGGFFDIRDMFGGAFGTGGPGHVVFQDTGVSTIYSVTFTLIEPIDLVGFALYLYNDHDESRGLTRFQLFEGANILSDVSVSSTYNTTYGSHQIVIQDTFAPVTASTFTAYFHTGAWTQNGVRVINLDAITIPEPSVSVFLACTAGLAFTRRRSRKA